MDTCYAIIQMIIIPIIIFIKIVGDYSLYEDYFCLFRIYFFGSCNTWYLCTISYNDSLLLLSSVFFAKGSQKFDRWFRSTKLYEYNILPIKNKRGFSRLKKIKILARITFFIWICFFMLKN